MSTKPITDRDGMEVNVNPELPPAYWRAVRYGVVYIKRDGDTPNGVYTAEDGAQIEVDLRCYAVEKQSAL